MNDKLIPLEYLCPGLSSEVYTAIHKGMAVVAEKRFQNVSQFRYALNLDNSRHSAEPARSGLMCLRGNFAGKMWYLYPNSTLLIGRNTNCDICYPRETPGVSRIQCEIFRSREGKFFVRDYDSRYGTRLTTAEKSVQLEPGIWYCADGAHVLFGAQEEYALIR